MGLRERIHQRNLETQEKCGAVKGDASPELYFSRTRIAQPPPSRTRTPTRTPTRTDSSGPSRASTSTAMLSTSTSTRRLWIAHTGRTLRYRFRRVRRYYLLLHRATIQGRVRAEKSERVVFRVAIAAMLARFIGRRTSVSILSPSWMRSLGRPVESIRHDIPSLDDSHSAPHEFHPVKLQTAFAPGERVS